MDDMYIDLEEHDKIEVIDDVYPTNSTLIKCENSYCVQTGYIHGIKEEDTVRYVGLTFDIEQRKMSHFEGKNETTRELVIKDNINFDILHHSSFICRESTDRNNSRALSTLELLHISVYHSSLLNYQRMTDAEKIIQKFNTKENNRIDISKVKELQGAYTILRETVKIGVKTRANKPNSIEVVWTIEGQKQNAKMMIKEKVSDFVRELVASFDGLYDVMYLPSMAGITLPDAH